MHKTLIELDPLRQQEWTLALDAHIARLKNDPASARKSHQQLKVEAFLHAVQASPAAAPDGTTAPPGPRVPKAIIVVDLHTLLHGAHPTLAMVCPTDHDAIHNRGYRLEIHDNHRTITWHRPDGTIEYHGPPPGRRRPPP